MGNQPMSWPDAFANVGVVFGFAAMVWAVAWVYVKTETGGKK